MTSTERDLPEYASRDEDHKRIWLSPACDHERTWCQDDQGPCDDCGAPSVEYVRADALASIRAELEEARADKARVDELLTAAVDDYDAAWKALRKIANIYNQADYRPGSQERQIGDIARAAIAGEQKNDR